MKGLAFRAQSFREHSPSKGQAVFRVVPAGSEFVMVCDEQTVRSAEVQRSSTAGTPLSQLREDSRDHSSSLDREVDRRLRLEFQEQQELQEQQHRQEIQRLRSYYSQQAEESEERYRSEMSLLQTRLQELSEVEAACR
ncbi:hypothetical protein NFI96_026692 [Prochilodus magdalenae]|nr:hypothetical protein NFI96_026692 [Prochilodus magdalenae]